MNPVDLRGRNDGESLTTLRVGVEGMVYSPRTRVWAAWLRLWVAVAVTIVALVAAPFHAVLVGALVGYTGMAALAVHWSRRGRWPAWHLVVYLVLDVAAVSLAVYAYGVNTVVAAFFFPLMAGYVLSWGARVGLVVAVSSVVAYTALLLLQRYAVLPLTPLAPMPAPPAGPLLLGLMPILLFIFTAGGVFYFLHYSVRRIERQNEALRQNLISTRETELNQRALQERLVEVERLESLGRLAGGVAHDFNNVLTAIRGYAELLKDAVAHDPQSAEDLQEVLSATNQAADLTQQLLAFSRKQVIQPKVIDVCELVAGLERMLVRIIGEDVDFKVSVADERCRVLADRTQLEQLIVNLVVNSRDALPQGGSIAVEVKPVRVADTAAEQLDLPAGGDYVLLTVRDSGMGIGADTLERIFEPFFTTKEKGRGTGLGLATVYGVVKQHGGGVRVSSAAGSGTTFRVYLPRSRAALEAPAERAAAEVGGEETVLVVEDEATLRRLVERVLTRAGYRVYVAADGPAALAMTEAQRLTIDLLLTDVVMPGMSGRQLALEMAGRVPHLSVLYMSGYTNGAIVDDGGVLAQDVSLLQKPFRESTLLEAVRAVLNQGEWRQSADAAEGQ